MKSRLIPLGIFLVASFAVLSVLVLISKFQASKQSSNKAQNDFDVESFDDFKKLAMVLKDKQEDEDILYENRIKALEDKLSELQESISQKIQTIPETDLFTPQTPNTVPANEPISELQTIDLGSKPKLKFIHVPAGSFAKATLLTGVYAPVNSEPLPVLLKLDELGIGPNKTLVPVNETFIIGKAVGDANSVRAIVQLEILSVVKPNGQAIEQKVNGYTADTDGIQGLIGKYVYRVAEVGGLAAITSGLAAGSDALADKEVTRIKSPDGTTIETVHGDKLNYASGKALAGTMDKISEIFSKRLNEITPAIFVTNGKQVTVIFINGVTLDNLSIQEVQNEITNPYSGLDNSR